MNEPQQTIRDNELVERIVEYWHGDKAAERSYPKERGRWPDDDHVPMLQKLCTGFVCEVGCGTGRCADAFPPERYIGVDINPTAIDVARLEHPDHQFKAIRWDDPYPPADSYLFHTCLMHVPDSELRWVLLRARPRIVIFESMMRAYSNPSIFNFQRDPQFYWMQLNSAGFSIMRYFDMPTNYQVAKGDRPPLRRRFMVGEVPHD